LQQLGFDRLLLIAAPRLPLCQRYAQNHQQYSHDKRNQAKTESDWHYNTALVSIFLAHKMKIVVAIAFILIIGSLFSALLFLMRDKGKSNRTVQALTMRVGFSVALFILLLVLYKFGYIQPTGLH
jgi:urea transporter